MAIEHAVVAQALGASGDHVLFVDLIEKAVFGQQRQGGEVADYQGGNGQRQVPEIVEQLAGKTQLVEIVRRQPAQREPIPVAAASKQHDQQNGEEEGGDGVTDDDRRSVV